MDGIGGAVLTLLLLPLGCAHHPDVAATASIGLAAPDALVEPVAAPVAPTVVIAPPPEIPESQLAPGTDCKASAYLPSWNVAPAPSALAISPSTASLPGTDVIVPFPAGLTVDPSSRPHHVVLTSAPVSAHPRTVVELWIVPVCRSYSVPVISTRMSQASMLPLVGERAAIEPGNLTIGDGIYLAGQGHFGDSIVPLWFRWVEVLHSADFGVAVAASCERTGRTSMCEADVAKMVDAIRAQAQPTPAPR